MMDTYNRADTINMMNEWADNREKLLREKLADAKKELETAGPIHSKDVKRHIHNLRREARRFGYDIE